MSGAAREFDLVLFGATGFVGRLTARHLAQEAPARLRIALAGRSLTRLQELARGLDGEARDWPLIQLDASDTEAVADPRRAHPRRRDDRGPVRPLRRPARRRLRRGRHRLLRPHRRGALRAPQHRRQPRDRQPHGRPHRARLRLRLDPERPRRAPHGRGGAGRRRRASAAPTSPCAASRAASAAAPSTPRAPRSTSSRSDAGARRVMADRWALADGPRPPRRPGGDGASGSGGTASGPRAVASARARPPRQGLTGQAGCRQRPLHRALRHGVVQHPGRRPVRLAARLRRRLPLRRVLRLRRRTGRCHLRRGHVGRAGPRPRRAGLPADPRAARPGAAQARRGTERRDPGDGSVPHGGHRGGDQRRAATGRPSAHPTTRGTAARR